MQSTDDLLDLFKDSGTKVLTSSSNSSSTTIMAGTIGIPANLIAHYCKKCGVSSFSNSDAHCFKCGYYK